MASILIGRSRSLLNLVLFVLLVGAVMGQTSCRRRFDYMEGNFLSLVDGLKKEYVRETPLEYRSEKILKEHLDNGWQCLSTLTNGVMLFQTHSDWPVDGSRETPVLFQESKELRYTECLFPASTPAGRWFWDDNQILVTTDKDPRETHYYLSYYPAPQLKGEQRKTLLDNKRATSVLPGINQSHRASLHPLHFQAHSWTTSFVRASTPARHSVRSGRHLAPSRLRRDRASWLLRLRSRSRVHSRRASRAPSKIGLLG